MAPAWQRRGRGGIQRRSRNRTPADVGSQSAAGSSTAFSAPPRSAASGPLNGNKTKDTGNTIDDEEEETAAGDGLDNSSDSDTSPQVILCLTLQGRQLGAVAYDTGSCKLCLLQDAPMSGGRLDHDLELFDNDITEDEGKAGRQTSAHMLAQRTEEDLVTRLLEQIRPSLVIASSKCTAAMLDALRRSSGVTVQIRPSQEFHFDKGRRLLAAALSWKSDVRIGSQSERGGMAYVYSLVDLDQMPLSTSCAAALATGLIQTGRLPHNRLDDTNDGVGIVPLSVTSIESIHLSRCLSMTAETREALGILADGAPGVRAPGVRAPGVRAPPRGATLFNLMDTARTNTGRTLLRRWFLFPSTDLALLAGRHDAVECLVAPDNTPVTDALASHLKGMKNMWSVLKTLQRGSASVGTWKGLFAFCLKLLHIRQNLRELQGGDRLPIYCRLVLDCGESQLQALAESIDAVIDWEQSATGRSISIKSQVDAQLDAWREEYAGLPSLLLAVARRLKEQYSFEHAGQINVAYFPQLGYLIALPFDKERQTPEEMAVPPEWTFHFASEICTYWKSAEMQDLDEHLGDLYSFITDREVELQHELSTTVIQAKDMLIHLAEACAELDVLLCFAQAARQFGWTRPALADDACLDVTAGRHPLQELCVDTFQPNDTRLQGGHGVGTDTEPPSLQIVTGPNGCGKSIYLKQLALIVFMAQIGSFVPAQSATIGVVDQIFTRIHSRELVARLRSSFMTDLGQVSHALSHCTARSLILLDEFGKGTLSNDGTALLAATISHLLERGADCPRTVVATHFHDVFHPICLPSDMPYQSSHMEVLLQAEHASYRPGINADVNGAFTFLYRIAPGHVTDSHAAFCALQCGIASSIVERAVYVTQLAKDHRLSELQAEAQFEVQAETATKQESRQIQGDDAPSGSRSGTCVEREDDHMASHSGPYIKQEGANNGSHGPCFKQERPDSGSFSGMDCDPRSDGLEDDAHLRLGEQRSEADRLVPAQPRLTLQRVSEIEARLKRFVEWDIAAEMEVLLSAKGGSIGPEEGQTAAGIVEKLKGIIRTE